MLGKILPYLGLIRGNTKICYRKYSRICGQVQPYFEANITVFGANTAEVGENKPNLGPIQQYFGKILFNVWQIQWSLLVKIVIFFANIVVFGGKSSHIVGTYF